MEHGALLVMMLAGCVGGGDDAGADAGVVGDQPEPADNASSPAKVALGRALFWDPILSGDRGTACATCHEPDLAYSDGRATPVGLARNAPTVLNTAWNGATADDPIPSPETAPMFWDNRAHSLEQQARGPLTTAAEMMGSSYTDATIFAELVSRLQAIPEYAAQFDTVYGPGQITEANIVKAIAAFERTLTNRTTSFDRGTLTPQQQHGLDVFTQIGCVHCHSGPMFSDYKLHQLRVPDPGGDPTAMFRTPSLRNVTRTAPYMHDGVFPGFMQVFQFYRTATTNPIDPALRGVRTPTPQEAPDVIAFLEALGDAPFDATVPASVPSGLPPGGAH